MTVWTSERKYKETKMVNVLRINELAKKARESGLTEEEKLEQAELRRQYIDSMRMSLASQLENTYIVDENGVKTKLKKKDEESERK